MWASKSMVQLLYLHYTTGATSTFTYSVLTVGPPYRRPSAGSGYSHYGDKKGYTEMGGM